MNPNEQNTQPDQEPQATPLPNTPSAPIEVQQPSSPSSRPQPAVGSVPLTQSQPAPFSDNSKHIKRVKVIAIIVMVLGILGVISSLMGMDASGWMFNLVVAIIQTAIGFGLYKFRKLAYIAFNVFTFLAILGYLANFVSLALIGFLTVALGGLMGVILLVLQIVTFAFLVTSLILIHPKPVRELFHW